MLIIKDIYNLHTYLNAYKDKGYSIGYIPTMGALHEGHGSLIEKSHNDNQKTIFYFGDYQIIIYSSITVH